MMERLKGVVTAEQFRMRGEGDTKIMHKERD